MHHRRKSTHVDEQVKVSHVIHTSTAATCLKMVTTVIACESKLWVLAKSQGLVYEFSCALLFISITVPSNTLEVIESRLQ